MMILWQKWNVLYRSLIEVQCRRYHLSPLPVCSAFSHKKIPSVWMCDVRHWILALPQCATSWILFAGVWVWHTQSFLESPFSPCVGHSSVSAFPCKNQCVWACECVTSDNVFLLSLLCNLVQSHPLCRRVSVFYCRVPSHAFSPLLLLLSPWARLIFFWTLNFSALLQCFCLQCRAVQCIFCSASLNHWIPPFPSS